MLGLIQGPRRKYESSAGVSRIDWRQRLQAARVGRERQHGACPCPCARARALADALTKRHIVNVVPLNHRGTKDESWTLYLGAWFCVPSTWRLLIFAIALRSRVQRQQKYQRAERHRKSS